MAETRCPNCKSHNIIESGPTDLECEDCGYEWQEVEEIEDDTGQGGHAREEAS